MAWLVALLGLALVLALVASLWMVARRRGRTAARHLSEKDPKQRQKLEEEIRRRDGKSGPTVAGGQHLS